MKEKWMAACLTIFTLVQFPVCAQEAAVEAKEVVVEAAKVAGEEVSDKKGPVLVCDEPTFNFGEKPNTTNVEHIFIIRNDGDEVLVVDKVKASCGCTVANISNRNIAPGETSEISTKLSLRGRKGSQNKQITVYSNDGKRKRMALRLTGRAIAEIDVSPAFLNFGNLSEGESAERIVKVVGNIKDAYKVTEAFALSKLVDVELTTLTEGKTYQLKVTVPAGSKKGLLNDRVRVKTDYAKKPQVDVRVTARITGKLVVSPDKFILQENADRALTRYIMVGQGSVKDFQVTDVLWPGEGVSVTPRIKKGRGVQIELKNVLGLKELDGKNIVIKTDVPEMEEILIPIQVRAARK